MVKLVQIVSLIMPVLGLLVLIAVGLVGPVRRRLKFVPQWAGLLPVILGIIGLVFTFICFITPSDYINGPFNIELVFWPGLFCLGAAFVSVAWLLGWKNFKRVGRSLGVLALGSSVLGLGIAGIFWAQINIAANQAELDVQAGLGSDYAKVISDDIAATQRPGSFNLIDYFQGMDPDPKTVKFTGDVVYRTVSNQKLLLDVYEPITSSTALRPALLVVHGGGWQTGDKAEYPELNYYLATKGWTVFSLDYRLLPDYGFPYATEDVQCALAFINQNGKTYSADTGRLAILGRSAGGTMAMAAAYMSAPIATAASCGPLPTLRGVVNYYGESDMVSWYKDEGGANLAVPYLGGTPAQQPENYRLASPLSYVNRPLPPTLILHGEQDSIVKIGQSIRLSARLKETANKVAFVRIPWTGHAFDLWPESPGNQLALYYTERFLNVVTARLIN